MTLEEHKTIGNQLKELRQLLDPDSVSMDILDRIRNQLDDIVCSDFPGVNDQEVCNIYYGPPTENDQ